MSNLLADPGSFRDPGGRVYCADNKLYRAIFGDRARDFEAARSSGLLNRLVDSGSLVPFWEVDSAMVQDASCVLEHPRLPYISYPYEWSFALLKSAALHHLDVQLEALSAGFTLSDATAYNVQFEGVRPVFIDHLSFRPYRDGEVWIGHRQFCMQFLNPLVLWSRLGVSPNPWFRGTLEGIAPEDLSRLLRWRDNLSWTVFAHVTAQSAVHRRRIRRGPTHAASAEAKLPRGAFRSMLVGLRQFIEACDAPRQVTVWQNYASANSYDSEDASAKRAFVSEMISSTKPGLLVDLGCNSGDYSVVAIEAGAKSVIGFDYDFGALELAYSRALSDNLPLTPLWLDAANPSPAQGWAQSERQGLAERSKANALIALAFLHHIVIGHNIPLDMALDWLMDMAPTGVIEFPSRMDPMVQLLLANREDIFSDYTEELFLKLLGQRARVVKTVRLESGGRLLAWYDAGM